MSKEEWFRSWFDSPYYPILYRNRDFTEARQFIDALLSFLQPREDARFLDVACGRGRHSIYLNSLGFEVTGIDISENSINEAQLSDSGSLHFYVHDMRRPLDLPSFNFALNLFTSFGYFDTLNEHRKALQNIHSALEPSGTFIIDYLNPHRVQHQLIEREHDEAQGIRFEIAREFCNQHILKKIRVKDGAETFDFEERVMAFSREELEVLLNAAGFQVTRVFGDYHLAPYTHEAPRIIIIATKSP